ncbi:FtsH protease activity modulator HflK [Aliiroseovarius lamellibrachiae]|uniref:FtsH protease activity modulator HflK n=1 Tax=Aliiroseovarius lamellibrachiae TaxID=1924933 RepID=UPI001BE0C999|nr:FtsH protease activity modulator HflK [Aliiroseovarius lamellibrachiae]MBT2130812.1 FtsH protease activity modulator HflK [Aliiroseovarius lamellibrachiae]
MASDNGGPWGGGGNSGGSGGDKGNKGGGNRPPNRPGEQPPIPEIEELMKKGQEQLRVLMGGRSDGRRPNGGQRSGGGGMGRGVLLLGALAAAGVWVFSSFYRVDTSEQSVEQLFGARYGVGQEGLNFAPWPIVTKEIYPVTRENIINIGEGTSGLMLTGDENIVDIDFQVVWNISNIEEFVYNLAAPEDTIKAVSESAMREIIARSKLTPILTSGREDIQQELSGLIQATLDGYQAGVNIVRVNFDKADPPVEVIDSFREVQAAEQTRDTLQKQADAYANKVVAAARGEAAQLLEEAEGYRARVVNDAEGEAARFISVYDEYAKAEEITRKRLYLETIEKVMGSVDKVIMDDSIGGEGGVVPYLPLNELTKQSGGSQ